MFANLKTYGRKLLKTVQTITTFRNPLADPLRTRRGPPLVRGPQFENRWVTGACIREGGKCRVPAPMTVGLQPRPT